MSFLICRRCETAGDLKFCKIRSSIYYGKPLCTKCLIVAARVAKAKRDRENGEKPGLSPKAKARRRPAK